MRKRIIIMNVTENPIRSFMNSMNDVFCFKTQCPIDVCQLFDKHNPFLKKISLLTNGTYIRSQSSKSLYGLFSYYFLPDISVRKCMLVPEEKVENMKVMCSCHGEPIKNDIAYVCTVCLAILCTPTTKCPIHYLRFYVCPKHINNDSYLP